jgi:hypothetical protein
MNVGPGPAMAVIGGAIFALVAATTAARARGGGASVSRAGVAKATP